MATYKHWHTHVTSPDPAKAVEFYTKVLGAHVIKERETHGRTIIDLDLGGVTIRISNNTGADESWKGLRFGLHHLGLMVDDLDKVVADMKSMGGEFIVKPNSDRPGPKSAFIRTPDNVLIEITDRKEG